ncbi:MAG: FKBP-type peptidyl-prolyl cis-trans isomerase [Bacteroidales bacterium]|nr:FKBP-type peptidyl-prolyl cis-trans isomerase [Bacteroidales bacterium]
MKKASIIASVAAVAMLAAACVSSPKVNPQPKGLSTKLVDSASYALGVNLAQIVEWNNLGDLNLAQVLKGYKDALSKKEGADEEFVNSTMNRFMQERNTILATANLEEGKAFLEKNAKADGVVALETGLQYKIVRSGNGVFPTSIQDTVEVNYEGKTLDGKVFDSSYDRGQSISFPLDRVIPGWTEGMQKIDEGGEITLYIPSDLAYGERGQMGPNQTLIFKVELIKVKPFVPTEE